MVKTRILTQRNSVVRYRFLEEDSRSQWILRELCNVHRHSVMKSFPNISVRIRILLTLPMSVASWERSFSKLKLVKACLR